MKHITVRKAKTDDVAGLSELFVDFIGKDSDLTAMKKQGLPIALKVSGNPCSVRLRIL
ncbi:hypothetical protein [Paenibacillus sp. URB8-2]|uniref:hypothetical protein n=1 Tax=Paenibacillus sp. URB8-2 TaxID=2741301 RepID=UPI0015BF92BD|nr:hypothetical protein [Paenibacillus sp. URB8-2]BCG56841.1 hypothetical protein PUR_02660 [Paenibacillus sp. URB8-2]